MLALSKLSFEAIYCLLWCAAFNESALALKVQDLLSKVRKPGGLRVREGRKGFYVECLKAVSCDSYEKLEALLREGIRNRSTAATNMNATSSRSHMVINLCFKQVRQLSVHFDTGIALEHSISKEDMFICQERGITVNKGLAVGYSTG